MARLANAVYPLLLALHLCAAAQEWPSVPLPEGAQAFGVGEEIVANGNPMRVQVFASIRPPQELADWYRRTLGEPLVSSRLSDRLVLGRQKGGYYQTIQLQASPGGTKGIVAVMPLGPWEARAASRERAEQWTSRMPAGTKLESELSSQDGGKRSLYLVMENGQSESLNRDRLVRLMADDGLALEREMAATPASGNAAPGRSLFFRGPGRESMATVRQGTSGRTAIVVNTVSKLESFQ